MDEFYPADREESALCARRRPRGLRRGRAHGPGRSSSPRNGSIQDYAVVSIGTCLTNTHGAAGVSGPLALASKIMQLCQLGRVSQTPTGLRVSQVRSRWRPRLSHPDLELERLHPRLCSCVNWDVSHKHPRGCRCLRSALPRSPGFLLVDHPVERPETLLGVVFGLIT
jgi:hypothetical protein